jgi:putative transcriptional regulator
MAHLPRTLLALVIALLPIRLAADTVPPPATPEPLSLRGQLLIAAPQMGDPRFAHTVILMVRHEASGALGIVLNRPFEARSVASLLAAIGRPADDVTGTIPVFIGGPVEPGAGFIVHSAEYRGTPGRMEVDGRLAVSLDPDVLADIGHGKGPAKALFALGYAGWGPGQLEGEMARRDWFTAPASPRLVFDEDREKLWDLAMSLRTRDL